MRTIHSLVVALALFPLVAHAADPPTAPKKSEKAEVTAQDDWEAPVIDSKTPKLRFGGEDWGFRFSFKNKGAAPTKGHPLEFKVKMMASGVKIFEQSISLKPPPTEPGKSHQYILAATPPEKLAAKKVTIVVEGALAASKEFEIEDAPKKKK